MSARVHLRRNLPEKATMNSRKQKNSSPSFLAKHFNKIYPFVLQKSDSDSLSSISLCSTLSLSQSQNSNESNLEDLYPCELGQMITVSNRPVRQIRVTRDAAFGNLLTKKAIYGQLGKVDSSLEPRKCNWITKSSDEVYVKFHDEEWGVPVYEDSQLFELLAMSAMLMDYNWTEILKRREVLRDLFSGFDPNEVVKMDSFIEDTTANKDFMLPESRIRCIVDNAKCILQVVKEHGSFSNYVWKFVNFKPIINKYRYPKNVMLRSPKAESLSKDLLRRGFRFVGPVIVHSFMQAAGLFIDHLVNCHRHAEFVKLS